MTYKEVILAIRGYENKQIREWERTRIIAYQVYTSIPKKQANKAIQSYLPLPSDNRNKRSREEMNKVRTFFLEKQRKANESNKN